MIVRRCKRQSWRGIDWRPSRGKERPSEALELIWRLMALANPVFGRCDDSSGTVIGIFHAACRDLGEIAQAAKLAPACAFYVLVHESPRYSVLEDVAAPGVRREFQPLSDNWPCFLHATGQGSFDEEVGFWRWNFLAAWAH